MKLFELGLNDTAEWDDAGVGKEGRRKKEFVSSLLGRNVSLEMDMS